MADAQAAWLARTEATVRRLYEDLAAAEVDELADLLGRTIAAIDPPPDRLHAVVLSMMGMEICRRLVMTTHEPGGMAPCTCHRVAWLGADALTKLDGNDASIALRGWLAQFLAHFEREHPRTGATLAAALIRADPTKSWRLTDLARAVQMRPVRLRHEFHARFGMRPSRYLHLVRVARAIALFRADTKVEAIAWEVGYKSKKDFYAALKQWVGATPTELRALADDERDWLERQLRALSVRGSRASGNPNGRSHKHTARRVAVGIGVALRTTVGNR